jgi:hypothetical protein
MHVKPQIRIIGWDDGPFSRNSKRCIMIGCVFRGGEQLDGILKTTIKVDGIEATEKIGRIILKSKFRDARIIMLDGITFGGFNIVNMKELYEITQLPVIAVNRRKPNLEEFIKAMKKFPEFEKRLEAVKAAGRIYSMKISNNNQTGKLFYQKVGISRKDAERIINISLKTSLFPEPLRVAHLIATGVVLGESVGRA